MQEMPFAVDLVERSTGAVSEDVKQHRAHILGGVRGREPAQVVAHRLVGVMQE